MVFHTGLLLRCFGARCYLSVDAQGVILAMQALRGMEDNAGKLKVLILQALYQPLVLLSGSRVLLKLAS